MTISEKRSAFHKKVLEDSGMTVLCGAFDGITARLVQHIGFDGCYMGGQAAAASMLGVPDIGLVTASEQIKHAYDLCSCVDLPYVMDADTGYGNALNVRKTLAGIEAAGMCAAHFEDQVTPKRCGGMGGVEIEPMEVVISKMETLVKYRKDPNFIIIGRTDAGSCRGLDEAIKRGQAMAKAGADMIFYGHILNSLDEVKRVVDETGAPVMYCVMEFRPEVCFTLEELKSIGVNTVIWPNGLLMRWFQAAYDLMVQYKQTGDAKTFFDQLMPIEKCNEILGIKEWNPPRMF